MLVHKGMVLNSCDFPFLRQNRYILLTAFVLCECYLTQAWFDFIEVTSQSQGKRMNATYSGT